MSPMLSSHHPLSNSLAIWRGYLATITLYLRTWKCNIINIHWANGVDRGLYGRHTTLILVAYGRIVDTVILAVPSRSKVAKDVLEEHESEGHRFIKVENSYKYQSKA